MDWKRLIEISRPVGWLPSPLLMLLAVLNFGTAELTNLFYVELILYTFPFSLFLYGINDLYDRDTDSKNDRKEEGSVYLAGRELKENVDGFLKRYSVFICAVLLAIPIIRQNMMHFAGTALFIFFSYAYSAPPLRLKGRAPLDSLANTVIYFLGPFLIGLSYTTASIPWSFVLWMIAGLFAGHAFTTIMDFRPDKKAGINTFAVRFGKRKTSVFSAIVFLTLSIIPSIITELRVASLAMGLVTVPMIDEEVLNSYAARGFQMYVLLGVGALIVITLRNIQLI